MLDLDNVEMEYWTLFCICLNPLTDVSEVARIFANPSDTKFPDYHWVIMHIHWCGSLNWSETVTKM